MKRRERIALAVLSHRKELGDIKTPKAAWRRFVRLATEEEKAAVSTLCRSRGAYGKPLNLRKFNEGWKGLGELFDEIQFGQEVRLYNTEDGYLVRYAESVKIWICYMKNGQYYWLCEFVRIYIKALKKLILEKLQEWGVSETRKHLEGLAVTIIYAVLEELGISLTEKQIENILYDFSVPSFPPPLTPSRVYRDTLSCTRIYKAIVQFDELPEALADGAIIYDTNVEIHDRWEGPKPRPPGDWRTSVSNGDYAVRYKEMHSKIAAYGDRLQKALDTEPVMSGDFLRQFLPRTIEY